MSRKDIAAKKLLGLNDIFADIVNGFLFDGEQVLKKDELADVPLKDIYEADDGRLREQERDILKLWKKNGTIFSLIGIENQSKKDRDMALRVIGYDGASYRSQLTKGKGKRYPVITLVMYYGEGEWNAPLSLKESLEIMPGLDKYVSDYRINVINVCNINSDDLKKFNSDYREILNFLSFKIEDKSNRKKLRHPYEIMQFLSAMLDDDRFEQAKETILKNEEVRDDMSMRFVIDKMIEKGKIEGREEGREEAETRLAALGKAMIADGRSDEVFEILIDKNKREELYKKYKIK